MKKLWLFFAVAGCCVPLFAAEKKEASPAPARPTTHVAVVRPTTPSSAARLTTQVSVPKPVTRVPVVHPLTPGSATAQAVAAGFGAGDAEKPAPVKTPEPAVASSKSSAGGYSPSYKNAKKLGDNNPGSALPPSAVKSGLGVSGAGDAERAAAAAASAKPDVDPATMESMMKKANIPSDIASKLKQRNFESARSGKKK